MKWERSRRRVGNLLPSNFFKKLFSKCIFYYLMKQLPLLLFVLCVTQGESQKLTKPQLRNLFVSATERKSALDSLIVVLESIDKKSPVEESYYGICNGLCCQYVESNFAKLKYVMKSKNYLNSAVNRDAKDPELRFMRLMLEHFLPSFLGLNKHISDDLRVIFSNPKFIDESPSLKRKVIEFLLWSKRGTPEQIRLLELEMAELNKKFNKAAVKKEG